MYQKIELFVTTAVRTSDFILTRRTISKQRSKYTHATIENILEELFTMWSAPFLALGDGPIGAYSDNRRSVFM
jgi:hypothetical protein